MKKNFLAVALVATMVLGLASCGQKDKCYEVSTVTEGVEEITYFWGTKDEVNTQIGYINSLSTNPKPKATLKGVVKKNEDDCKTPISNR